MVVPYGKLKPPGLQKDFPQEDPSGTGENMVKLISIPDTVAAIGAGAGISAERNHALKKPSSIRPLKGRAALAKLPTREANPRSPTRGTLGIERGRPKKPLRRGRKQN